MGQQRCVKVILVVVADLVGFVCAVTPKAPVTNLAFPDLDIDELEIGGAVTWTAPVDMTGITVYNVYFATDAAENGKTLTGTVTQGSNEYSISAGQSVATVGYIIVRPSDGNSEFVGGGDSLKIEDRYVKVTGTQFEDYDLDTGEGGGTIFFQIKGEKTMLNNLKIFLDGSPCGGTSGKTPFRTITDAATTSIEMPFNTVRTQKICFYTASSLAEQSADPTQIDFYDRKGSVADLEWTDLDFDQGEVGGSLTWKEPTFDAPPSGMPPYLTEYVVKYGKGSEEGNAQEIGRPAFGVALYELVENTDITDMNSFFVYSTNSKGTMTTSVTHVLTDVDASVSDITFEDFDLDSNDLSGKLEFTKKVPTVANVRSYNVYMAGTSAGGSRSSPLTGDPLSVTRTITQEGKGAYNYFVVYAESTKLWEQTTPVAYSIVDLQAIPRNLQFVDTDTDTDKIGGTFKFDPPAVETRVASYEVYRAEDASGSGRSALLSGAISPTGQPHSITLQSGTSMDTYTHFVVYAISAYPGEPSWARSKPQAFAIVDLKWQIGEWGACSQSCGDGTQTRTVTCSRSNDCTGTQVTSKSCRISFCSWTRGEWSACVGKCGVVDGGEKTRSVSCIRPNACGSGLNNKGSCTNLCAWNEGDWSACNQGTRTRCVSCPASNDAACGEDQKPPTSESCPTSAPTPPPAVQTVEKTIYVGDGCGDNLEHSSMRPWGRDSDWSCTTQWWIIFVIVILSLLLLLCCLLVVFIVGKKMGKEKRPDEVAPQRNDESCQTNSPPDGENI